MKSQQERGKSKRNREQNGIDIAKESTSYQHVSSTAKGNSNANKTDKLQLAPVGLEVLAVQHFSPEKYAQVAARPPVAEMSPPKARITFFDH